MENKMCDQRNESQRLHQESQAQYDKQQNALCFLVIGGMLLIIGFIFIFLANRRENNVFVGIDIHSLAFYIMVVGLSLGGVGVVYGGIRFIVAKIKQNKIIRKINSMK